MKRKTVYQTILRYAALTCAGAVNAFGVTLFLLPASLLDSGFSGTSLFLSHFALSLSVWLLILNFPVYIFAYKKLGWQMLVRSLWAIAMYSLFSFIFQMIFPSLTAEVPSSPIAGTDLLLCALFGGLISGIGSGLTIRFGGAIDGVEVLSLVFAKKLNLTVGTFVMIFNVILYVASGIAFSSWELPLYSVISYGVGLKAVDFIVDGLDKGKAVMIITEAPDEMLKSISGYFGRGITIFDAKGYYSDQCKKVVYVVVNRFEIARLKSIVEATDPNAFVTITEITDTMGANIKLRKKNKSIALMEEPAAEDAAPAEETVSAEENE
ncbi:MAG: molybdenum cofactor biosynthesis protein [Bacillota bacterium]|nr:MAG: molybdenum cofactor biosynthesis protein [Bacillota bacterium]